MGSVFLSSGFDTSALSDGSIQIFASNLGAVDLQPGFPVKVSNDQQLESKNLDIADVNGLQAALTSIITNPFNGTLEVQNLITAYDSTPVDLNQFVAATLNDLSDLKSNTQYITSSFGQTAISSNILTNDIKATQYQSQDGSVFIDMTSPGDINVSATDFLFNGDPVLTSASAGFLKLDGTTTMAGDIDLGGNDIINTATIQPVTDGTQDIGTFLNSYKDIYLDGQIKGSVKSNSANSLVSGPASSTINNIATFNNATGDIKDSTVSISSISGGPFLPLSGGTMLGTLDMANQTLSVNNMSDNGSGIQWGASSNAGNNDAIVIGPRSSTTTDSVIVGRDSSSAGVYGVVLGVNSSSANNTAGNVAIGAFCNSSGDTTPFSGGGGAIAIGFTVDASNKEAIAIGSGLNNGTASSLLIGGTAPMVNWRSATNGTCDLGTSGNQFKDIYASGNLNGISAINTASSTINFGLTNTTSGTGSVSVGSSNTAGGSGGGKSIIYGNNNNTSGSTNGQCIIYGNDNTDSNAAGGSFIYGFGNTNGTGQRNILIGRNNAVPNGVNEAFVMGFANTNSISNSLLVGGGSMANIRPGSNALCDLGVASTNAFRNVNMTGGILLPATKSNVNIGFGNTNVANSNIIQIGDNNSQGAGTSNISIGNNVVNQATSSIAIGPFADVEGNNSIGIGVATAIGAGVVNAIAIGNSAANGTSNSAVIGGTSFVNIRGLQDGVTDLGVGVTRFKDLYLSGTARTPSVDTNSAVALNVGGTVATSLNLGRAAIVTTINGTTVTTTPYGSWYCTASFTLSFSAGVNRLIPPVASSNGPQVDFSFAAGVLTYTGARANRVCQINYSINFLLGPSGANMTFFNSKNGNLTLSAVQARAFIQSAGGNQNTRINICLTDNVVASNGDTFQLAGSCASLQNITFDLNSCNITGILN